MSATVPIQVHATDNRGVRQVSVYARTPGKTNQGVLLGTTTAAPYVVSWYTSGMPNLLDLELYASVRDAAGNTGISDSIPVTVSNAGAPQLAYLAGFNVPNSVPIQAAAARIMTVQSIQAPQVAGRSLLNHSPAGQAPFIPGPDRTLAVEWGWYAVPGADGYGIYHAQDAVGPYKRIRNQAAATGGLQRHTMALTADQITTGQYGTISVISQNSSAESGFSNAAQATFLPDQQSASPADGQEVRGGRPTLTWMGNPAAEGYLFYVYDGPPTDASSQLVWTNAPRSTSALGANYPSALDALKPGTYHWWVAGVAFDAQDQANAFSFSAVKRFIVP